MNFDLKFYFSVFLRRLPYFLIVLVTVMAVGLAVALFLPAKYRAAALLLVEGEQIPGDLAPSTVRTSVPEQLEIIKQQLLTRSNLLEMANRFSVYAATPGMTPTDMVNDMRSRIGITSNYGRNIASTVTVSFEGPNPDQALQVTNELVTMILQANLEMRTGSATQTLDFFQQEVDRLGVDLDRQESELLAFRTQNQDSLPDSLDYRRTRQALLQERLLQLQREEGTLTDRKTRLVDLYERTGRVEQSSDALTPEQRRLQELRAQLDSAKLIYSEQNPRVKALQTQVDALEKSLAGVTSPADADSADQPSFFELQVAQIDGDLAYLRDQKDQVSNELEALRQSIERTPANAARLSELERANEITRGQYSQAVNRLAQAQTGERIEVLSKGQRITVIEQAVRPNEPFFPPRKLIAVGSLGAGLALGLGLVLLIEILNRAVRRPLEIVSRLGITPIATLPYIRTRQEQLRRRSILLGSFLVVIGGSFGGLYVIHHKVMPIDVLFDRVLDRMGVADASGMMATPEARLARAGILVDLGGQA